MGDFDQANVIFTSAPLLAAITGIEVAAHPSIQSVAPSLGFEVTPVNVHDAGELNVLL